MNGSAIDKSERLRWWAGAGASSGNDPLVGHADDRGDATANSRLAEQRAAAVLSYLVVQGIDQARLTAASGGEQQLLRDNSSQYGRAGNRRVEILVQKPPTERVP